MKIVNRVGGRIIHSAPAFLCRLKTHDENSYKYLFIQMRFCGTAWVDLRGCVVLSMRSYKIYYFSLTNLERFMRPPVQLHFCWIVYACQHSSPYENKLANLCHPRFQKPKEVSIRFYVIFYCIDRERGIVIHDFSLFAIRKNVIYFSFVWNQEVCIFFMYNI